MRSQKLVIGIDYGTTNTGAAYALVPPDSCDDHVDINVVRQWPHGGRRLDASDKLPSEIAYDKSKNPVAYGFDIPEGLQPLQWVKLLLQPELFSGTQKKPNTERVWRAYEELERLGKTPVDVIADYLAWLWQYIQDSIRDAEEDQGIFNTSDVTVVMTVPASWPDRPKDCLLQAAKKAGIESPGTRLKFQAEPEAAAIFGLKARVRKKQVNVGDCIIICNAGGGTVDVVTYQVLSKQPLALDQVVVSKGKFCGSAFVDAEFECQLRSILGKDFERLDPSVLAQIREDFEYKIKRTYNPEKPSKYAIPVTGVVNDKKRAIQDGRLKLDDAVLRASFETIMTQTMTLIDTQRDELKAKGLEEKLKGILLVGGFGGSDYLHTRIRQEYPEDDGIKIWRGD